MDAPDRGGDVPRQLALFDVGRREVAVVFDQGDVTTDTGLLAVRQLDRRLGVVAGLAARMPDPRSAPAVTHTTEDVLTQILYQILAGYFDANDADVLRDDALFRTIVGRDPDDDEHGALASGSTLARFRYAFTRREHEQPVDERTIDQEVQQAKIQRVGAFNEWLAELFVATRKTKPPRIVLDIDATDDPTHGQQQLTLFHGYYEQWQYLPQLIFEGDSGFPLAALLRPGTAHASWGAVALIEPLVALFRRTWPGIEIIVRADCGYAVRELYEFCEANDVRYAIGFPTNDVLKRRADLTMNYVAATADLYNEPRRQFVNITDYQAASWDRPRRVIGKCEITAKMGPNQRFVISDLAGPPRDVYTFYTGRGDTPERGIGQLKHGLSIDRLSSTRFLANAFAMHCHVAAYALFVLFREANASVPEIAEHTLSTVRSRVFKCGAVVQTTTRQIRFHASSTWPGRGLFARVLAVIAAFARTIGDIAGRLAGNSRSTAPTSSASTTIMPVAPSAAPM